MEMYFMKARNVRKTFPQNMRNCHLTKNTEISIDSDYCILQPFFKRKSNKKTMANNEKCIWHNKLVHKKESSLKKIVANGQKAQRRAPKLNDYTV